ncbi:MAG: DUF721 domain-containing protein [Planctomycetota bacterium]
MHKDDDPPGPRPIQHALREFLRQTGLGARPQSGRVFAAWTEVVGPVLAARAVPVRFRDGELVVEVESAVHLQELKNFTGERFRQRANAELGTETIRKLAFKLKG